MINVQCTRCENLVRRSEASPLHFATAGKQTVIRYICNSCLNDVNYHVSIRPTSQPFRPPFTSRQLVGRNLEN